MKIRALVNALILSSVMLGTAQAVQVVGGPTPQNQQPAVDAQSAAAVHDESNGLAIGVIDEVDVAAGRIVIHGVPLQFDPATVQVFSVRGTVLSPLALQKHQNIGFLLDPRKDPKHPTVRVVYLR
jgi:hypothetical protein